jgi:hypothetical protein
MGPDGTVFLFPMMVFPGAVGVSGMVRLFGYLRSRENPPPADAPLPEASPTADASPPVSPS